MLRRWRAQGEVVLTVTGGEIDWRAHGGDADKPEGKSLAASQAAAGEHGTIQGSLCRLLHEQGEIEALPALFVGSTVVPN